MGIHHLLGGRALVPAFGGGELAVNARGVPIAASVADLHSANNKIGPDTIVAENGRLISNRLYTVNQHDVLTARRPTAPPSRRTRT
jgi:hypothetical protein